MSLMNLLSSSGSFTGCVGPNERKRASLFTLLRAPQVLSFSSLEATRRKPFDWDRSLPEASLEES